MKKLAVVVMMIAIATFMAGPMASADDHGHHRWSIDGLYAVTGFTSCSPTGLGVMEADYTFNHDGTGSAQGVVRNISMSGTAEVGAALTITVNFKYEVTREGRITFGYPSGGFKVIGTKPDGTEWSMTWSIGPSHGVISPDGKTITITCGPPKELTVIESEGGPPLGYAAFCVTTFVGMRLQ